MYFVFNQKKQRQAPIENACPVVIAVCIPFFDGSLRPALLFCGGVLSPDVQPGSFRAVVAVWH